MQKIHKKLNKWTEKGKGTPGNIGVILTMMGKGRCRVGDRREKVKTGGEDTY